MVDLNGIRVKNRFFIGSGPAKYGNGYNIYENPLNCILFKTGLIKPELFGGVVTKTITIDPRKGNYRWYKPWKVLRKLPDGYVNRFGWNNCGIKEFISRFYPAIKLDNLIPSIGALKSPREFLIIIAMLNKINILAVELNISCPHVKIVFRNDFKKISQFFTQAVKLSSHPLIVKLGAMDSNLARKAKIAEDCGINAISAINTIPVNINGFGICGKSGRGIKEVALRAVSEIVNSVDIPVIGGGGIDAESDCCDFFNIGAQAVFFASMFLAKPLAPQKIVQNFIKK